MPSLPSIVLLLLLLLLTTSASAASFTCAKPSTCQPAIGYVVPNATTYEQLIFRFRPTSLNDLLAANQLPCDTNTKQTIPAGTSLHIPFRCRCTGDGVGESELYAVQTVTGDDIVTANSILLAPNYNDQPIYAARLPCSCDQLDGSNVMHFAYIVRTGDNTSEIAAKYEIHESTLLRINNITNHTNLRRGQILDIPLQGMGTGSTIHCISGNTRRSLRARSSNGFKVLLNDLGLGIKKGEKFNNDHALAYFIGVVIALLSLLLVAIILALHYRTWFYWRSAVKTLSSRTTNGTMQFDYSVLARGTHGFSEKSMLGEGNYGTVHKATYEGQEVAVKKMKTKNGTADEFHSELQTISNTKHKNLVRLKGWCGKISLIDGRTCWKKIEVELLLVFELIPNGSLEDHLYKREQALPWEKRYEIVKGIGSGLRYLHHECNPCILHRDIKPGNILLDDQFNAKIGDFGLSLIIRKKEATAFAFSEGSLGYMDPQLEKVGVQVEHDPKSDVYSFGILLLEIACMVAIEISGKRKGENPGRKSREEIWGLYNGSTEPDVEAAADPKLRSVFDRKQMERVVVLGLKCSQLEKKLRPSMDDAMKFLEDDGQDLPFATEGEVGYIAPCSV